MSKRIQIKISEAVHRDLAATAVTVGMQQGELIAAMLNMLHRRGFMVAGQFDIPWYSTANRARVLRALLRCEQGDADTGSELAQALTRLKEALE